MEWLSNLSIRRPIVATVLILAICVVGVAGYSQLGLDRFPKIDIPIVSVTTTMRGAAPEDIESEVTEKLEESLNTISGIDELRSTSAEGVSQVVIKFALEKDLDVAAQEVRDKVNRTLPLLPSGIDQPIVTKMDPDAIPIITVAVEGEQPIRDLTEFADKAVRPRIENVNGVGQVQLIGGRLRQINVVLDPMKLRSLNLTAVDVQRALATQNMMTPGGRVEAGPNEFTLRVNGRVETLENLGDVVVRQVNGHSLRLRDLGRIEDGVETAETVAYRDGRAAVLLSVVKQSGSNTVAVVDGVRERVASLQKTMPAGYKLEVVRDDSGVIRTSVHAVTEHLILGALFASLIVLVFLGNLRSTIIAAVAIPTSIIGTFALMWLKGFTLNVITLLALALAVGIVIDDAIVVLENIFRHIDEKKKTPLQAAFEGTKEIALAVLATTASLIVIFLPIAFLGGIPGRFLGSFGWTMAFAIAVSLLVSFTLTPMMASRMLKSAAGIEGGEKKRTVLERLVDVVYRPVERAYMAVLTVAMRHRWVVVVASIVTLGSCVPLVKSVPKGFLPRNDEAQLQLSVRTPEGTSLAETALATERYAREIRKNPNVDLTLMTVGSDAQKTPNLGTVYVHLVAPDKRKKTQDDVIAEIRDHIVAKAPPEHRVSVGEISAFGGATARVQYVLRGPDLRRLEAHATSILDQLRRNPKAVDVDSSMIVGKPEIGIHIDRARAADLGVQVSDIATATQLLVGDVQVSNFRQGGEDYEVHMRADADYRADVNGLALLTVPSSRVGQVPLSAVVTLEPSTGPSVINRLSRERQITITANPAAGVGDSIVSDAIADLVKAEKMSPEYRAEPTGATKEMGNVMKGFAIAFLLSFIFMYLVLAAQFDSWLHPVTILISLPLTVPFALLSLLMLGQSLNMFSMLGILVLFGVVKKNSILQIDHTNHLRREGMSRHEAVMLANKDRLRPILMTTLAFVAGMLPLAFSKGIGAGQSRAISGVVVGGQMLSLLLTLLATPVVYTLFDDLARWFRRKFNMGESEFQASDHADGHGAPVAAPALAREAIES